MQSLSSGGAKHVYTGSPALYVPRDLGARSARDLCVGATHQEGMETAPPQPETQTPGNGDSATQAPTEAGVPRGLPGLVVLSRSSLGR